MSFPPRPRGNAAVRHTTLTDLHTLATIRCKAAQRAWWYTATNNDSISRETDDMTGARTRFLSLSSIAAAAFVAVAGSLAITHNEAQAQAGKLTAGTLTCAAQGTTGLILGSKERLVCTYNPAGSGPNQAYDGVITKVGLDIGVKGKGTLIWTVLGSSANLPAGELDGQYAGVSADAAVGIGVGANALIGGNAKSVVLQPLSVRGQTGLNLSVGVTELQLTYRR